ncbi:MAG: hypothetical protein KBT31_06460 [Firmicutes bacterium]|nr:hypothetical protein [Candidatus Colimorpha enterica]
MDKYSPNEWTKDFVRSNEDFCFSLLKEINNKAISLVKSGSSDDYAAACIGLNQMMNGATVMQAAGIADMRPVLSTSSFDVGILVAFGCTGYPESKRKETAILAFEDCKDFSKGTLADYADQMIELMRSNTNLDDIKNDTFPDFPNDLIELMSDTPQKLDKLKNSSSGDGSKPSSSSSGGCYVATCVYGSYDCPQVWTLRRFRDNILAKTWYGRAFIHTYYAVSPTFVKWFGKTKWFKRLWKNKLDSMVEKLNDSGIEDTPYQD